MMRQVRGPVYEVGGEEKWNRVAEDSGHGSRDEQRCNDMASGIATVSRESLSQRMRRREDRGFRGSVSQDKVSVNSYNCGQFATKTSLPHPFSWETNPRSGYKRYQIMRPLSPGGSRLGDAFVGENARLDLTHWALHELLKRPNDAQVGDDNGQRSVICGIGIVEGGCDWIRMSTRSRKLLS